MTGQAVRIALGAAAVTLVAGVSLFSSARNPPDASALLMIGSVGAIALMVEAVVSRPGALLPAILLGLAPVVGLLSEGAPTALAVPFAGLLLLAAELCALSWDRASDATVDRDRRRSRLAEACVLGVAGVGAGAVVAGIAGLNLVERVGGGGGTLALGVGAIGLALLTPVLFGGRGATDRQRGAASTSERGTAAVAKSP